MITSPSPLFTARALCAPLLAAVFVLSACPGERIDTNTPPDDAPQCEAPAVGCPELPASRCQGRLAAIIKGDPSGCSCQTFIHYVDCAARGERCEEGACVPVAEACRGIACPARAPSCEGDTVVADSAPGVCDADSGECVYENRSQLDCALQGLQCAMGRCAPAADPCDMEECKRPSKRCDDQTAVRYSGRGVCSVSDDGEARCDFASVEERTDCAADGEQKCVEGNCVDPDDPCDAVTCDRPPAPSCDAAVAVTYSGSGTCDMADGMCDYSGAQTRIDCAADGDKMCLEGACVDPDDPCDMVTCDAPPAASCDGAVAVTYSGLGTCDMTDGMCDYAGAQVRTDCAAMMKMCQGGLCQDQANPCDMVTCDRPPAASCDGAVAVTYSGLGTCDMTDGMCDYSGAQARTDCAAMAMACVAGACQ